MPSRSATPASSRSARQFRPRSTSTTSRTTSSSRRTGRSSTRRRIRRPGWPLPPAVIGFVPGGSFPARFTYLNFGKSTQRGLELGVNGPVTADIDAFANYSWQGTPDPKDFDLSELNIPAKNRFNVGFTYSHGRYLGDLSVNYSGSAFWQDVLDDPYPRHDEGLHAGERRSRRPLVEKQGHDIVEGHQPRQSGRPAARLRRHPEAAGCGGDEGEVLKGVPGVPGFQRF